MAKEKEEGAAAAVESPARPKPGTPKAAPGGEKTIVGIEYEVSVTHCLLGTRRVVVDPKFAEDAAGAIAEAVRLYKGTSVRSFEHQPTVTLIGPVYGEAAAAN